MKIKICGMRESENIKEVAALSPDYMGFIFYKNSPRYITQIPENLSQEIKKTGVFVNEDYEHIIEKVELFGLQAVQLHGEETAELCTKLRNENLEVIKAFAVSEEFDFETLTPYTQATTYFLFDTKGKNYGGNGVTFNWDILQNYTYQHPFFLSGGIAIEHIQEIKKIEQSSLPLAGVDLNSKFEIAPGFKNTDLLKQFKDLMQ